MHLQKAGIIFILDLAVNPHGRARLLLVRLHFCRSFFITSVQPRGAYA